MGVELNLLEVLALSWVLDNVPHLLHDVLVKYSKRAYSVRDSLLQAPPSECLRV